MAWFSAALLFLAAFCLKGKAVGMKRQNFFRKKIEFIFRQISKRPQRAKSEGVRQ